MFRTLAMLCILFSLCLASSVGLTDSPAPPAWNRFHGPQGHGVFAVGTLPAAWVDTTANSDTLARAKQWSVSLGSRDVGSPIIHGDVCYLLVSVPRKSKIELQARDMKTGSLRWSKAFDQTDYRLHSRNTLAASTPATDDSHVYFAYSDGGHTWIIALQHVDGEVSWERDFGRWQSSHGFGSSPQVVDGKVVLLLSQQATKLDPGEIPGDSRLIAVDAKSGLDVWSAHLKATRCCYGVPAVYRRGAQTYLIGANTGNGMFAIDAVNGRLAWEQPVFDKRCCSSPLVVDDIAIGTSGGGGGGNHLVAVRIPGENERPEPIYRLDKFMPYVPTPAVKDGKLFTVDDKGIAACINVQDGELLWKQRLGGNFGASPIIVGDHVLFMSLDGQAFVAKAADRYEPVNKFRLGGAVGASPAFDGEHLLIRVGETLNCW